MSAQGAEHQCPAACQHHADAAAWEAVGVHDPKREGLSADSEISWKDGRQPALNDAAPNPFFTGSVQQRKGDPAEHEDTPVEPRQTPGEITDIGMQERKPAQKCERCHGRANEGCPKSSATR